MSARRDPFSGPEERPSNYSLALIDLTDEQRQRARLKVAADARDSTDCRLLLAALGLAPTPRTATPMEPSMLTVIQPSLLDDTAVEYTVARTVQTSVDETVSAPVPVLPGQLPLFEDGTL